MHTSSFNCCDLLCCYSSIFLYAELFNDPTRWTINYGFKWGWWLYLSDHRWTWIWRSSSRVKKWRQMEDQITYIYIHTTHLCGYSCYANTIFTWRLFFLILLLVVARSRFLKYANLMRIFIVIIKSRISGSQRSITVILWGTGRDEWTGDLMMMTIGFWICIHIVESHLHVYIFIITKAMQLLRIFY